MLFSPRGCTRRRNCFEKLRNSLHNHRCVQIPQDRTERQSGFHAPIRDTWSLPAQTACVLSQFQMNHQMAGMKCIPPPARSVAPLSDISLTFVQLLKTVRRAEHGFGATTSYNNAAIGWTLFAVIASVLVVVAMIYLHPARTRSTRPNGSYFDKSSDAPARGVRIFTPSIAIPVKRAEGDREKKRVSSPPW